MFWRFDGQRFAAHLDDLLLGRLAGGRAGVVRLDVDRGGVARLGGDEHRTGREPGGQGDPVLVAELTHGRSPSGGWSGLRESGDPAAEAAPAAGRGRGAARDGGGDRPDEPGVYRDAL